eukprot:gene20862-22914_t
MEAKNIVESKKKRKLPTPSQAVGQDDEELQLLDDNMPVNDRVEQQKHASQTAEEKKMRWKWTDEMTEKLILFLHEHKSKMDYKGKDMEADLTTLYSEMRRMMGSIYPPECFGPLDIAVAEKGLVGKEKELSCRKIAREKKSQKTGYERIKSKIKGIRQNFKKAVTEGTHSGSGRLMVENWDSLVFIWGGCPSVSCVGGSVQSLGDCDSEDKSLDTDSSGRTMENDEKHAEAADSESQDSIEEAQRDQMMVRAAKDELELKKQSVEILQGSTKSMEIMVTNISQSINCLGQQLGNGLAMLAQAMGRFCNKRETPHQQMYQRGISQQQLNAFQPQQSSTPYQPGNFFTSMLHQDEENC